MSKRKFGIAFLGAAAIAALWFARGGVLLPERSGSSPRFPSYFMQRSFVDDAFAVIGTARINPDVSMVLVNHHLLVSNFIARIMAGIATEDAVTVVLVSPDHFARGIAPVTSVVAQWPTPFGDIHPASAAIETLAVSGVAHLEESPFYGEHGVTNITMFIKRAMPHATLVPIIVRDDATDERIDALAGAIGGLAGRVIVIGSFDFTHDSTDEIARVNDARSLHVLVSGDPDSAADIAIDSKPGIRLMMQLARIRGLHFTVVDMSNSAKILRQPTRTDVTSYITGVWAP